MKRMPSCCASRSDPDTNRRGGKKAETYRIKVTLVGITPAIWRPIHVEGSCTLVRLHRVLQAVVGWENYALYALRNRGKMYGPFDPDDDFELKLIDAKRTRVHALLPGVGSTSA
jgi:hypothetical protein